ncbi:MAG: cobalamin-dependent protein [bacterium]
MPPRYDVVDLGRNVPVERSVLAVRDGVQAIGMSSLMTTTMPNMAKVVEALKKAGLRERARVLVGGAPVTPIFAERIGADGYAPDAHHAVLEFNRLLK